MPQDSPATDAGTGRCSAVSPSHVVEHLDGGESPVHCQLAIGHNGPHSGIRGKWHDVPDTWAPINRRELRDDVDRFRNMRMPVPQTPTGAVELAALALEYYEHAHEVATRTAITLAELDAELVTFLNNTTPDYRAVADARNTCAVKDREAVKELAVADRRLRVAIGYMNFFKGD